MQSSPSRYVCLAMCHGSSRGEASCRSAARHSGRRRGPCPSAGFRNATYLPSVLARASLTLRRPDAIGSCRIFPYRTRSHVLKRRRFRGVSVPVVVPGARDEVHAVGEQDVYESTDTSKSERTEGNGATVEHLEIAVVVLQPRATQVRPLVLGRLALLVEVGLPLIMPSYFTHAIARCMSCCLLWRARTVRTGDSASPQRS